MDHTPIQLLEEDLAKLFHHRRGYPNFWDYTWSLIKSTATFLVLFLVFYMIINIPAYSIKAGYFWNKTVIGKETSTEDNNQLKIVKTVEQKEANTEPLAPNGQTLSAFLKSKVPENDLIIPAINVKAPVTWNSNPNNILDDLKNGVAHYGGTALPGENGNVFVTGHSSNYWWDKGKFNQIFALLDKVKVGDRIYTNYNNQPYVYQVEDVKIVKPSEIEVLNPTDHSVITLMTCTPVGTALNRLIVQARQIYPVSSTGLARQPIAPDRLPTIR